MKIIFTFYFMLFLLLSSSQVLNASVVVDKIAAVVNNEIIMLSELEKETERANALSEQKVDKKFILQRLIDEIVLNQEASKRGVAISEEELDAVIEQLNRQVEAEGKNMDEELAKQKVSREQLREQWKIQMLSKRLLETEMHGKIAVTEDEILEYYRTNYGEVEYGSQIRIAHILIPFEEENAYEKALEISQEAKSGKDFSKLAQKYSKDEVSASKGGDLGYFNKGDLVFELESAVERTGVNQITDPVETSAGYHIVKVLEKKETSETSLGGYREQIRNTIYTQKSEQFLKDWVDKRRSGVYIDIKI